MASTLNEMANKLQEFIIDMQSDAHSFSAINFNMSKYNNLKLSMDEGIRYPHITVRIGISEATYSLKDHIRTEGGLGPDEKYIRKWLENGAVEYELEEIYKTFLDSLTNSIHRTESDEYAIEVDAKGKIRRVYEARAAVTDSRKAMHIEKVKRIKKDLKNYLNSTKRRFS